MISKTFLIGMFGLLLVSGITGASNWTEITGTGEETKYFLDKDSIRHLASGLVRVWSQIKYKHSDEADPEKEIIQYLEFDCNKKKARVLQKDIYYSNGEYDYSGESFTWQYITPDTLLETTFDYLCNRKIK